MAKPARKTGLMPARATVSNLGNNVQQRHLSRERIAQDMAAFRDAGGQIEVLGNTPLRTHAIPAAPVPATANGKRPIAGGDGTRAARSHKRT